MTSDRGARSSGQRTRSTGQPGAPAPENWTAVVRSVIAAAEASDVYELEVRTGGFRVSLRRVPDPDGVSSAVISQPVAGEPAAGTELPPGWALVESPLTGIWYDAPAPGAAPYVAVGDAVSPGAVIGLVETMKVFNEVTSDIGGVVRQVFAQRGDLVSAHAPLVAIETLASSEPSPEAAE